ncbi:MAG: hypothetical protein J6331_07155 [Lentisphaeria bacterium]|nr:hypothetical protein [Lentisphaeria bacterium]
MPLRKAVKENRYEVAQFLVESGMGPDPEKDADLLVSALENKSMPLLKLLLPFFDLNRPVFDGRTPLFSVQSKEAAETLIRSGAKADWADHDGMFPYQAVTDPEAAEYLKERYFELRPVMEFPPAPAEDPRETDWSERFMTKRVSIADLVPVDCNQATGKFRIRFEDRDYDTSERFVTSFARKLKFSANIFNYFSAEEVFSRVQERNPDTAFKVTFDRRDGEVLGVVDENKKILPAEIACNVFAADPRILSIRYSKGVWEAEFLLNETFTIRNDSEYARKILVHYPVDGVSMPCVYLCVLRQVCSNGAVAMVPGFRTDIEINDESGTHLSRLLRSYNNENGFMALESRLQTAQDTLASVNELMKIENLIAAQVTDQASVSQLTTRLEEMAGDPCARYETTSLSNIAAKKRPLIPVDCSVNDLFNFCSELTTHHDNILAKVDAFNGALGSMLAQEFDLEEMYHNRRNSKAFHLDDLDLTDRVYRSSAERRHNTVFRA